MGGTAEAVVQFVKFGCAKCSQHLMAPVVGVGTEIECPGCKEKLVIPALGEARMSTACPRCAQKLKVPTESAGTEIKCPVCTHAFNAPPPEPPKPKLKVNLPKMPRFSPRLGVAAAVFALVLGFG